MANLKPLNDKVIIKPIEESKTTEGGIILPDTVEKKIDKGEVIAVGPGKLLDNGQRASINVKVGDIILFESYSTHEVKIGKEEFLAVNEEHIICIIEK